MTGRLTLAAVLLAATVLADATVAPHPDPRGHVEYDVRPCGGMFMMNPAEPDSPVVRLPQGSYVSLPRWVPGADPEAS